MLDDTSPGAAATDDHQWVSACVSWQGRGSLMALLYFQGEWSVHACGSARSWVRSQEKQLLKGLAGGGWHKGRVSLSVSHSGCPQWFGFSRGICLHRWSQASGDKCCWEVTVGQLSRGDRGFDDGSVHQCRPGAVPLLCCPPLPTRIRLNGFANDTAPCGGTTTRSISLRGNREGPTGNEVPARERSRGRFAAPATPALAAGTSDEPH